MPVFVKVESAAACDVQSKYLDKFKNNQHVYFSFNIEKKTNVFEGVKAVNGLIEHLLKTFGANSQDAGMQEDNHTASQEFKQTHVIAPFCVDLNGKFQASMPRYSDQSLFASPIIYYKGFFCHPCAVHQIYLAISAYQAKNNLFLVEDSLLQNEGQRTLSF